MMGLSLYSKIALLNDSHILLTCKSQCLSVRYADLVHMDGGMSFMYFQASSCLALIFNMALSQSGTTIALAASQNNSFMTSPGYFFFQFPYKCRTHNLCSTFGPKSAIAGTRPYQNIIMLVLYTIICK